MKREVNVTKLVKTAEDLRYCPAVLSANGRIRPDWVLVNGKEGGIWRVPTTSIPWFFAWRSASLCIRRAVAVAERMKSQKH